MKFVVRRFQHGGFVHDPPPIQNGDVVGVPPAALRIMSGHHHRAAARFEPGDAAVEPVGGPLIQTGEGLVQKQELRFVDEGTAQ